MANPRGGVFPDHTHLICICQPLGLQFVANIIATEKWKNDEDYFLACMIVPSLELGNITQLPNPFNGKVGVRQGENLSTILFHCFGMTWLSLFLMDMMVYLI